VPFVLDVCSLIPKVGPFHMAHMHCFRSPERGEVSQPVHPGTAVRGTRDARRCWTVPDESSSVSKISVILSSWENLKINYELISADTIRPSTCVLR